LYEVDLPDTTVAHDLYVSVARGDISQSSFGFACVSDTWPQPDLRELIAVELFDVSPVTFPAYPQSTVGTRQLGWYLGSSGVVIPKAEPTAADLEKLRLMLELAKRLR
jgi:phage head maturation protease